MKEKEALKLFRSITNISDDIIENAQIVNIKSKKKNRIKFAVVAACLCLIIIGVSILQNIGSNNNGEIFAPEGSLHFPENIHPEIMVNGKIYYWEMSTPYPVGYTKYGEISKTTKTTPDEDCEIMIGSKKATGTIYINEETPNVIYVYMTTDWFENQYVRFISAELKAGQTIYLAGTYYRIAGDYGVFAEVNRLPKTCEYLGKLKYIGMDNIPQKNLETNCPSDSYNRKLDGRAVYFDTADPDNIYVYTKKYTISGEYDAYIKCPKVE